MCLVCKPGNFNGVRLSRCTESKRLTLSGLTGIPAGWTRNPQTWTWTFFWENECVAVQPKEDSSLPKIMCKLAGQALE